MWTQLRDRAAQSWWADAPLAAALVIVCSHVVKPGTGIDQLGKLTLDTRRNVYTDLIQVFSIFAGFSAVAFAFYLGLSSRPINQLKSMAGRPLLRIWLSALAMPWICALVIIFAKIMDFGEKGSASMARWFVLGALLLVVLQTARLLWVFYQIALLDLQQEPVKKIATEPVRVVRKRAS